MKAEGSKTLSCKLAVRSVTTQVAASRYLLGTASVVVLAVDAASDAGRQDAAAPGQQPGPLGSVLRAADEGSTGCPQAADDDTHQATSGGPGPDGRLSPAAGQGQLHAHRGGGVGSLPSQDPGTGEA